MPIKWTFYWTFLKGMDKFLERYSLPKLNEEEIENMNRSITSTKIETVIQFSLVQRLSHV